MTANYVHILRDIVVNTPPCNNYHFETTVQSDDMHYQTLGEHSIHLLTFQLRNEAGNGSDDFLELFVTETPPRSILFEQQHEEQLPHRITYVIAPSIWWNREFAEPFSQFSLVVFNRQLEPMKLTIEEVKKEVDQRLSPPINRLYNSVNSFCKLIANEDIHQKVLASLRPKDVGRMESVCITLRGILRSNSVDNSFWKVHYERLFGKDNVKRHIRYRKLFGDEMMRQMQAARMLALPSPWNQKRVDVPTEPLRPFIPLMPSPYDPPRPVHPDIDDYPFFRPSQPAGPDTDDPLRIRPTLPTSPYAPIQPPTRPNHPYIDRPYGPHVDQPHGPYFGQPYGPHVDQPHGPYFGQPYGTRVDKPYGPHLPKFDGPGSSGGGGSHGPGGFDGRGGYI